MNRGHRPVFLTLARLRFPVGAVASIGHRMSGVLLALVLPLAVLALEHSLSVDPDPILLPEGFQSVGGRIALAILAWAAAHHLFAGMRHLLMDIGVGSELGPARMSAYAALGCGGAVALAVVLL